MTEADLLAAAKSGDRSALETLFILHRTHLFRTAHRITRNKEDAEDALQETLLAAHLHLVSFDGRSAFGTWLTRIAINAALMLRRRNRSACRSLYRNDPCEEVRPAVVDRAPNPEARCAERERKELLLRALASLQPSLRVPLQLHIFNELSAREIATHTGLSVAAAKGRLFHARTALRKSKILRKAKSR